MLVSLYIFKITFNKCYQVEFIVQLLQDLIKELKSETSFNFETVIVGLCLSATEFDCTQLKKAMKVRLLLICFPDDKYPFLGH